jgi:hypothetical protein
MFMSLRMDFLRRDFASLRTHVEAHLFHEVSPGRFPQRRGAAARKKPG